MGDFTEDDSRQRLLTQHRVPWLKQCSHAKQCLPDIVTPCWSKNCRYESSLRHRRNLTLVKSVCETAPKSLLPSSTDILLARHAILLREAGTRDEPLKCPRGRLVHAMIGLLKKPLSICQSDWRKTRSVFPVILRVRWGPRTRITALLRRRY